VVSDFVARFRRGTTVPPALGAAWEVEALKRLTVVVAMAGLVIALTGYWSGAGAGRPHQEPGLASTISAWKKAFKNDSHCNPTGFCFGSMVHNAVDGTVDEFVAVEITRGRRVSTYDQAFPSDTSASEAEQMILRMLPSDAKASDVTVAHARFSCGQLNITSRTAGKELGKADPTGEIGVEFFNGTKAYDASNVEDAIVTDARNRPGHC
jgi:hypothetical protein